MQKSTRKFYILISSLVISLIHLPVAFAKSAIGTKTIHHSPLSIPVSPVPEPVRKSVYDSLQLQLKGLSQQAFDYAKQGLEALIRDGKLVNDSILSIIDFSLPSSKKRLFVIDLKKYKVLFQSLVAHGRNSGRENAEHFSNQQESFMSSPGFYVTGDTYDGKNGYSLKLVGLEKGINDHAYDRGIVMHGADYVSQDYVNAQGFIGRSQGCPAVPVHLNRAIINSINSHSCLFIYHPKYVSRSPVLSAQF